MTEDEIQRVINELKEWAAEEYGGQSALARKLGFPDNASMIGSPAKGPLSLKRG
jgi:hypothetical protein